jgi:hypothetical protein
MKPAAGGHAERPCKERVRWAAGFGTFNQESELHRRVADILTALQRNLRRCNVAGGLPDLTSDFKETSVDSLTGMAHGGSLNVVPGRSRSLLPIRVERRSWRPASCFTEIADAVPEIDQPPRPIQNVSGLSQGLAGRAAAAWSRWVMALGINALRASLLV